MEKEYTAYGFRFKNERDMKAFKQMKSESRSRALERKKSRTKDEIETASIRNHFRKEAKRFGI